MAVYLKRGKSEADRTSGHERTRQIVEKALADIESRGDAAVREMAVKFDDYSPERFRLSLSEIESIVAKVPKREMEDIRFAQEQIRAFAKVQRGSMRDVEVETMPDVVLGHNNASLTERPLPIEAVSKLRSDLAL